MIRISVFLGLIFITSCSTVKYFVVRHAEKATASEGGEMFTPNDPPLSSTGKARAIELREALKEKKIQFIYSTNTIRTINTAKPLSELSGISISHYNTRDSLDYLISHLKSVKKGNSLIVGHSNTVDDIVNKLCSEIKVPGDLPDSEYDNLYIITKKGKMFRFENKTYGTLTN